MTDKTEGDGERRWEIRQSLVERLRIPWEGMGDMANQQRAEAAVQIKTMMDEIDWLRCERDALQEELARLHRNADDGA